MKNNFNYLAYFLIASQLELDLLLAPVNLQGLIAILFGLFIFPKKLNLTLISFTLILILIFKFITSHLFLALDFILILTSFLLIQILKKQILFKKLIYYLVFILYLITSNYLANLLIFKIPFHLPDLIPQILLNFLYSLLILNFRNLLPSE